MAAGPQQIAAEGYRNHGLFTYALLEGLAKAGNYPLAPRYPKVLAMLGADAPQIATKPTHVVIQEAALLESRGATATRQIGVGEQVTVLKSEDNLAQIAQHGKLLGYVDKSKLVELKW